MGLLRILCSSAFACALVLLLVGCGTNPTTGTTTSNSSAAGLTTSPQTEGAGTTPQTEGTGPEAPQSAGNGGVSVPLAGASGPRQAPVSPPIPTTSAVC